MPKFTELYLDNLKPTATRYEVYDTLLPAFSCRVGKRTKTFQVLTSNGGRIRVGHYPRTKLAEARERARAIMSAPKHQSGRTSVSDATLAYIQSLTLSPNTVRYYKQFTDKLDAKYGNFKLDELTSRMLADIIISPHNHLALKVFFNWCKGKALIDKNPMDILKQGRFNKRSRILSYEELANIWPATNQMGNYGKLIQLCILTGQRPGELSKITSNCLNSTTMTIPATITKNKKEHSIPLSTLSTQLLQNLPISKFNYSKGKTKLDKLSGVTDWEVRDLRRTFATNLGELGVEPHIIERLLNHTQPAALGGTVGNIYNRFHYQPQMKAALELYEQELVRRKVIA
jgi:integrase